jgi:hypothetical protein
MEIKKEQIYEKVIDKLDLFETCLQEVGILF